MNPSGALPLVHRAPLRRAPQDETWLAEDAQGGLVVMRRVRLGSAVAAARVAATQRSLQRQPPPSFVPLVDVARDADRVILIREHDAGVPVARLQLLASVAPSVAAALADASLHALQELHERGMAHGSLRAGDLFVGSDGAVRISDAGLVPVPPRQLAAVQRREVGEVCDMVLDLWKEPRRARHPELAALLAADLRAGGSAAAALDILNGRAGALVTSGRAGLAALAQHMGAGVEPRPPAAEPDGHAALTAPQREAAARSALDGAIQRHTRRRLTERVAAAAAAAIAAGGIAALSWHLAAHAGSSHVTPTPHAVTTPTPAPPSPPATTSPPAGVRGATGGLRPSRRLSPPAPPATTLLTGAQLQPVTGQCTAGRSCSVTLTVHIGRPTAAAVTWELVAVNVCTGSRQVVASSTVTAQPAWSYVYDTVEVTLPGPDPQLLYAVTQSPVRIAAQPLSVPGSGCAA